MWLAPPEGITPKKHINKFLTPTQSWDNPPKFVYVYVFFLSLIYTPPPLEGKMAQTLWPPRRINVWAYSIDEGGDTPQVLRLKTLQSTFKKNQHDHCIKLSPSQTMLLQDLHPLLPGPTPQPNAWVVAAKCSIQLMEDVVDTLFTFSSCTQSLGQKGDDWHLLKVSHAQQKRRLAVVFLNTIRDENIT